MGAGDRFTWVEPTEPRLYELVHFMRRDDARECLELGKTPYQAAKVSLELSEVSGCALSPAGRVVAMYGLVPLADRPTALSRYPAAIAWCLTTREVERYPLEFFRASKAVLAELHEHAEVLCNHVDVRYGRALRWLEALGFSSESAPGGKFVYVHRRA